MPLLQHQINDTTPETAVEAEAQPQDLQEQSCEFVVCRKLHQQVILGFDFLTTHKAQIDMGSQTVSFYDDAVQIALHNDFRHPNINSVASCYSVTIKPQSQTIIHVKAKSTPHSDTMLLEPNPNFTKQKHLLCGKSVSHMVGPYALCVLYNSGNTMVHLKKGTVVGHITELDPHFKIEDIDSPSGQSPNEIPSVQVASKQNEKADSEYIHIAKSMGISLDEQTFHPIKNNIFIHS